MVGRRIEKIGERGTIQVINTPLLSTTETMPIPVYLEIRP